MRFRRFAGFLGLSPIVFVASLRFFTVFFGPPQSKSPRRTWAFAIFRKPPQRNNKQSVNSNNGNPPQSQATMDQQPPPLPPAGYAPPPHPHAAAMAPFPGEAEAPWEAYHTGAEAPTVSWILFGFVHVRYVLVFLDLLNVDGYPMSSMLQLDLPLQMQPDVPAVMVGILF